jgi:uncharacterized protein (DUF302 family)
MVDLPYGVRVLVHGHYEETVERVSRALAYGGFHRVTSFNPQDALADRLPHDVRRYVILVVLNPALASRALHADTEAGLLLLSQVIVRDDGPGRTVVAAVTPLLMAAGTAHNPALTDVARETDVRLRRALSSLEGAEFHAA